MNASKSAEKHVKPCVLLRDTDTFYRVCAYLLPESKKENRNNEVVFTAGMCYIKDGTGHLCKCTCRDAGYILSHTGFDRSIGTTLLRRILFTQESIFLRMTSRLCGVSVLRSVWLKKAAQSAVLQIERLSVFL